MNNSSLSSEDDYKYDETAGVLLHRTCIDDTNTVC